MDEKKVREAIIALELCEVQNISMKNHFDMAIEALEKQLAKKPMFEGDGCDRQGNIVLDTWICPNCESEYEVEYDNYGYCCNCGQKIDLSEQS